MSESNSKSFRNSLQAALLATQRSRFRREGSDRATTTATQTEASDKTNTTENGGTSLQAPGTQSENSQRRRSTLSAKSETGEEDTTSLALSILGASSSGVRKASAESLFEFLIGEVPDGDQESSSISPADVNSLIQLAQSENSSIRRAVCSWIAANNSRMPRGNMPIKEVLEKIEKILKRGQQEGEMRSIEFALKLGQAVAKEGEVWARRMVENDRWDLVIDNLLQSVTDPGLATLILTLSTHLARATSSAKFMDGCVRCLRLFVHYPEVVDKVFEVLAANPEPIEDSNILLVLLQQAAYAASNGNFKMVCDALKVVRPRSNLQAQHLTILFEEGDVMNTINALYRSQTGGSKLECALFLEALVGQLRHEPDSLVRLCESGVVIRLIRLASPSAGTMDDDHELAYVPAINTLTDLAKVDRIGARIVLAGGLGCLFVHANSSKQTRNPARKALQALGVTNLGSVVDAWIKMSRASRQGNVEEPLERIRMPDGSDLLWTSPPPNFFTSVVSDPKAVLGRGAFSTVYKSVLVNGQSVAVKRLTKVAAADPGFAEEIRVLARVPPHPNIIGLLGVFLDEKECLIISELGGPTLAGVLEAEKKMLWRDRMNILTGIADGIRHLHGLDPCILHLDLKASNVLLVGSERIPKLCDFGLAVELKPGYEFLLPGERGTVQFMAPECMRETEVELAKGFDEGADVYSFAMVMWELAHPGLIPWQGERFELNDAVDITTAIRQAVLSGRRPKVHKLETLPPGYSELMARCWSKHSSDRPRFIMEFFEEGSTQEKSQRIRQTIGGTLRRMVWELRSS